MILDDKFHYYIKPVVNPKLFPFCTKLTGITQNQVDNGILLEEALKKLDKFLEDKVFLYGISYLVIQGIQQSNFCFVTCGHWDLKTCLKNETLAKNISVKPYLKSWINLKIHYPLPKFSGVRNPDMVAMLKLSNLELCGK